MEDFAPHPRALATDGARLTDLFGTADLLPLWIAETYLEIAEPIRRAMEGRAGSDWYGYEARPDSGREAFWEWMRRRHGWDGDGLTTLISPSVGTTIGVLMNEFTDEGDGVIIQPPVFTDFKPLVAASNRTPVRSPLQLADGRYRMDIDGLEAVAADPSTRMMILCNPHNPVGRAWTFDELRAVAGVCAAQDVMVVADEIHADVMMPGHSFVPFQRAVGETGVRWAAAHGPIKTFGLAGVCDTLIVTDSDDIAGRFETVSGRLHLTRNNVFSLAAFEAGYREGGPWLDSILELVAANVDRLAAGLTGGVSTMAHEATYLAWLDLRDLNIEVPDVVGRLGEVGLALSPGHWFGRAGAGFARMSIAVPSAVIDEAIVRLNSLAG